MNTSELKKILENHRKWLNREPGGIRVDLSKANLEGANLEGANLNGACLVRANLVRADLEGAILEGAILEGANLEGANLEGANLKGACLVRANLVRADLEGANLRGAYLWGAILEGAILEGANLLKADLRGANLRGANIIDAKLPDYLIVPKKGKFIGYKKVRGKVILKLEILGKRMNSLVGRKCRTDKARVLEALGSDEKEFQSIHDYDFIYRVGEIVEVKLDDDIRTECTNGIHFFMTEQEARDY